LPLLDRLSYQLYSSRNFPPLERQLAALAAIGYRRVEPYGALLGQLGELKAGLTRHGMSAPSLHVGLDRLRADLDGVVALVRSLGARLVVAPYLQAAERPTEPSGWRTLGSELAGIRGRLAHHGLDLAWHNHDFELMPHAGGAIPLDLLLESDPGLLWEADIGWIARAGADPLPLLERYDKRVGAVHLKDLARPGGGADEGGWADVGHGRIDWPGLLPALERCAAAVFVVEHDEPKDFERSARRSFETVAGW